MAGASAKRTHVNRLVNGDLELSDFDIVAVPGGFSFGDHLGSGRLLGNSIEILFERRGQSICRIEKARNWHMQWIPSAGENGSSPGR